MGFKMPNMATLHLKTLLTSFGHKMKSSIGSHWKWSRELEKEEKEEEKRTD